MKTDKEILKAFQEQFNTGRLITESQVLVLMGMARDEERLRAQGSGQHGSLSITEEIEIRAKARTMSWAGIIFPEEIFLSFRKDGTYCISESDTYEAKALYIENILRAMYVSLKHQ